MEAVIYQHANYQGRKQVLSPGWYNMNELTIGNDALSSLQVTDGLEVTLYQQANFKGTAKVFTKNTPFVGADFNDKTSSIVVQQHEEKLDIYLRGSAFDSSEGKTTFLKVNGESRNMSKKRGLNTVILNPDGSFKTRTSHDVFGSRDKWNNWAKWVNNNAVANDIVAAASYDAIRNAPKGGAAEALLTAIDAQKAFNALSGTDWRRVRSPYALLFTKGDDECLEVSQPHQGKNAHLKTTLSVGAAIVLGTRAVLNFDGAANIISAELDVSETDHTVSIWFKTSHKNCGIFSVDAGEKGAKGHDRHIYLKGGNIYARVWKNETIHTAYTNYADNEWHRVTHVFGGNIGAQRIYVDGELKAQGRKAASDFNWQNGINIGYSNDAATPYFKGHIAEVSLWTIARPEFDLTTDWRARVTGNESGLLGYWSFEEGSGTTIKDRTGHGHAGTLAGAAQWSMVQDFPGEFLPSIQPEDVDAVRNDAETLAQTGSSLGTGYEDNPPEELSTQPLSELISQGLVPQYDLMLSLQQQVKNNQLTFTRDLLGDFGKIADVVGQFIDVMVTVRNPNIEFVTGQPGMVGAPGMETTSTDDIDTALATPEDHALKISGDVTLYNTISATLQYADFFHYKGKPQCSFKFLLGDTLGVGDLFPGVPLIQALTLAGPTLIACTAGTLYDPGLDSGINEGFNFFGNLKIADSDDDAIKFIGDLLQVKELAMHAAVDTSGSTPAYIIEAAVQRDITLVNGSNFQLRFTRSDISLEVKGKPPEPSITLSNDLVVTLKENGETTHLVFTGGVKIEPESITGMFTMNGTGRSPEGALSGQVQNTGEWKEPFGIPGIIIRQMAVQMGCTYVFPWIDNIGVHGNLKIGDIDGSISVLVDTNDPDQFVLAGSSDRITLLQIMSAMSPVTFAAYQAVPASLRKTLNNVIDVALEDVKISIVPSACSIGGVHFRDEGITLAGKLVAWGWQAGAFINVDTFDGITVRADMDPINIANVLKITGAQGDPAPLLRMQVSPHSTPYLYVSAKISLLALTEELKIEADSSGLSFFFKRQLGSILTTKLTCVYQDEDFEASGTIDFNLNLTVSTPIGDLKLVDIGFDAAAAIKAGKTHGFYASLSGSFRFYGADVTLPTLTLNVAPNDFEALYNAVLKQIVDNAADMFASIFGTLAEWAEAVAKGVVEFAGDVADVAKDVYKETSKAAIAAYKTIGKGATEVANGLKSAYQYTSKQVATAMKSANYAAKQVAGALEDAYSLGADGVAEALKGANYAVNQVGGALKNVYNLSADGAAKALKGAGYAVNEVGNALESAYNTTQQGVATALKGAGYAVDEVGGFMKDAYSLSADGLNTVLKGAGYAASEVEGFFSDLGGEFANFFGDVGEAVNPSNW